MASDGRLAYCQRMVGQTGVETAPRVVSPVLDSFEIAGRQGTAFVTIEPDPLYEVGEVVLLEGDRHKVLGIERYAIEPAPGRNIGLLLVPCG